MIRFCVLQGFKVTVEGIETDEMLTLLDGSGCHAYQGYLFAKPMPLESLLQLGVKSGYPSINDCAQ
jgi:EAL domain-containing protein (putative c-di-GMP-specific phosphodiesterase class I)